MTIRKSYNTASEYAVFEDGEYIGFVYAVAGRMWASVCTADREIIAFVRGTDCVQYGAELLVNRI